MPPSSAKVTPLIAGFSIGADALPVVVASRTHLVDDCFNAESEFAVPSIRGPIAVVTAALKEEWEMVRKLIDAGAPVESADETGLTPLMVAARQGNLEMIRALVERRARIDFMDFEGRTAIHYAMVAGKREAVELLLSLSPAFDGDSAGARDLLTSALASGDMSIFQAILERFPPSLEWTGNTRRALEVALQAGMKEQVRLLLSKHPAPPTREGGMVPLIAYAIASDDTSLFRTLLSCGSDPNLVIPKTAEKEFMALIKSKYLRLYIQEESGVNLLMLAAGLGKAGLRPRAARRGGRSQPAYAARKNVAALFRRVDGELAMRPDAARRRTHPEQLRVEISLAKQHANVIKDGTRSSQRRFRPAATGSRRSRAITLSPTRTAIIVRRSTNVRCLILCG